jgi:hypothetical protein
MLDSPSLRAADDAAGFATLQAPRCDLLRSQRVVRARDSATGTKGGLRESDAPRPEAHRNAGVHEAGRSGRQPLATLGPASLQDGSTCSSRHAMPEPVLAGPTPVVGLIGALHPDLLGPSHRPAGGSPHIRTWSTTSTEATNTTRMGRPHIVRCRRSHRQPGDHSTSAPMLLASLTLGRNLPGGRRLSTPCGPVCG